MFLHSVAVIVREATNVDTAARLWQGYKLTVVLEVCRGLEEMGDTIVGEATNMDTAARLWQGLSNVLS